MTAAATLHAVLVLPTFNEADNIERAVRAAHAALQTAPTLRGHTILVVDDDSPDGTGAVVERLMGELPSVQLLHRTERTGLGPAYLAGFAQALAQGADLVLQMDSDLSHDPNDLPRLVAAAADGADVVLGSRYVPGGSVTDWSWLRRFVSRGGSCYARLVLGVPVNDLTGGFKCYRANVLRTIDLESVDSKGYSFQVELTYRAVRAGFTVREIPIVFRDRVAGTSKMNPAIAVEAIHRVPRLRFSKRRA